MQVAKELNIPYYYKELAALAARDSGLDRKFLSKMQDGENPLQTLYLSTAPAGYAIEAQSKMISKIAESGSGVIVGRAAGYVLRDNPNVVRIFIYANKDYRINKVMEMYNDDKKNATKYVEQSDKNRANYYKMISGEEWGNVKNYDLCIDSSIGIEKTAKIICDYIRNI